MKRIFASTKMDASRVIVGRRFLPEGARFQLFDDIHYSNHVTADFYHHWKEDRLLTIATCLRSWRGRSRQHVVIQANVRRLQ